MDVIYTVVKFFGDGGFFMYPILAILAIGVAISIERYVTLTLIVNKNKLGWQKLEPLIMKGDFQTAREIASTILWVALDNTYLSGAVIPAAGGGQRSPDARRFGLSPPAIHLTNRGTQPRAAGACRWCDRRADGS